MPKICVTRAIKNAKFLQATAPHILPADEPDGGFASLVPLDHLSRLASLREEEVEDAQLKEFIRATSVPTAGVLPAGPLFGGSLVFARITFNTPGGAVAISAADVAVAVQYATLAVVPISAYASQYGTNSLSVDPTVLTMSVDLGGTQYNDQTLRGWVNTLAAQPGLPPNPCIVVLSPQGVTNTDGDINQGILGYHHKANVPYCFCNVFGQNLTVDDQANVYAVQLSHEIAEMTVDPDANNSNPEVCDPCGPNCQTVWLDYFGGAGNAYIQTTQSLPPGFAYTFFINAIVQPSAVSQCPPTSSASCAYAPPKRFKEHKDKDLIKEGIKEFKEVKEQVKEIKEVKDKDIKEIKEKDLVKEHPEKLQKDIKEKEKDKDKDKDIVEGPPQQGQPQEAMSLAAVVAQLQVRVENLERRLATGSPFIAPNERPVVGQEVVRDAGDATQGKSRATRGRSRKT